MAIEQPSSDDEQWSFLEEQFTKKGLVVGKVIEADEKCLVVNVKGVQGIVQPWPFAFMWAQANEIDPQQDKRTQLIAAAIHQIQGQEILLQIAEIDKVHKHLVLNKPTISAGERQRQQRLHQEQLQTVQIGEIRQGVITNLLENGGVQVDLDGLQGWIPRTKLSTLTARYTSTDLHLQGRIEVVIAHKTETNVICSLQRLLS